MALEVETARLVWPGLGAELAIGIAGGKPVVRVQLAGELPRELPLTPGQCDVIGDALDAAADIAEGVPRAALTSPSCAGIVGGT